MTTLEAPRAPRRAAKLPQFRNVGIVEFDSARPYSDPNGYMIFNCYFCPDCAEPRHRPDVEMNRMYGGRTGSDDDHSVLWLEDEPVFFDAEGKIISRDDISWMGADETDSPSHCDACGALIYEPLTADGAAFVKDYCRRRRSLLAAQYRRVFKWVFD